MFIDIYVEDPEALKKYLQLKNIGSRVVYPPLNSQPAYKEYNNASYPVTEALASRGIWLPSSSALTNAQINRVCDEIENFYVHNYSKL